MKVTHTLPLAIALLFAFAAPGKADPIFNDDFEGVTSGGTILNWDGGASWDVMTGTVDLVKSGDYGITCAGGTGYCVDMDGSTRAAGDMVSLNVGPLAAGTYEFTYSLSGNQRQLGFADSVVAAIEFGVMSWAHTLSYTSGWQTFTQQFTLESVADPVYIRFAATGSDNIGMVLDNVQLKALAVPEPATLSLMLLGFAGLFGARAHHRQRSPQSV
jgi:hypothetical protein